MDILALLFPREKKFYKMIEEQVALVSDGVNDFNKLIVKFDSLSKAEKQKLILDIGVKEKKDDILYTQMVRALKSTFITPMDREDLHQLVSTFDTIIDTLELLMMKLGAYNIKKIDTYFRNQTEIFYKEFRLLGKMVTDIQKESQVEKHCREIRALEQEADRVYIKGLGDLHADSVAAKDIIKYSDLYASMEEMIDEINEASLIIENIVVKYS
ncbi:DUF47 family protein [Candidatus Gottesmanbacteria bacterium]|nr:DUF47 family protein [Candidatus Gottesmanbacteria bacterium]